MATTYHVTFAVDVEPETDLDNFQPGSFCATLAGVTGAQAVGGTEAEAVAILVRLMCQGIFQRLGWNGPPRPLSIVRAPEDQSVLGSP